ncbi:Hypothetical protein CM240_2904 [Clostridium bornimense]|uniref:N-acetyltransferase domain-containing protein n=2 Tax=Clostridium TaxID=1485 RepID=W6RZE5_9CLOT|nr:GNAT family N-acetyltransferase [Clostridium bornimense]CDM70021.1 Hypothetical protein CM240_2904 [Clostridium bornimense]
MMITIRKANKEDAKKLKEVSDKAFLSDYVKYGECPGYGQTIEKICTTIVDPKRDVFAILCDGEVVGKISVVKENRERNYLGCLCIIPEYENLGIGQKAMRYIENYYKCIKSWYLVTPADKLRNHYFYKKCGYSITGKQMDGKVEVVTFEKIIK